MHTDTHGWFVYTNLTLKWLAGLYRTRLQSRLRFAVSFNITTFSCSDQSCAGFLLAEPQDRRIDDLSSHTLRS